LEAVCLGIPICVGLQVGDCERRGEDIGGMTVNIAARVLALAGRNEIPVTSTVRDALVGTDVTLEVHGQHELRGVQGAWVVYRAR
jgi:class 3 adenylate cyclase